MFEKVTDIELMVFWQKEAGNFRFTETVARWNLMPLQAKQEIYKKWMMQQECKN